MQATKHITSFSHEVGAKLSKDLRVFLFKLGTSRFGVPLDHVRSVAQMPTSFMGYGARTENHFVFQDSPLTYISLWNALELKSRYSDCDDLLEMLPQRKKDHVSWMDALESSIQTGTPFTKARDPHECAFGKWYYGYKTTDSRLSLLLREFEKPHATIHALADQLLGLVESGNILEAKRAFENAKEATLPILLRLFNDTNQRLLEIRRRVVIIVTDGVDAWALGADDALGLVDVAFEQVTQFASESSGLKSKAASALVTLDDHSVVPLLDWSKFCEGA